MGPVLGSARFTGEAIVGWLEKKGIPALVTELV